MNLRKPLTTTHPHGHVLARADRRLGLIRISKNASTESKVRLECRDWIAFAAFDGPTVAFLREPVSRFVSGVPETMLRMTHWVAAESWRGDRVEVPEDVYAELAGVAREPISAVVTRFLDLVEYAFFDAHHEPQHAFLSDRNLRLRIDPLLYLTESFEDAIARIEARTGIVTRKPADRGNRGGAKPEAGRTRLIDLARRTTRTGVYRKVAHSGFLGLRYRGASEPMRLRDLNGLANRFTREVKEFGVPGELRERILALYDLDNRLWQAVTARGGDVAASEVWPELSGPQPCAAALTPAAERTA
jgi:hypothetical protein